jgi:hypothetical protein
LDAQNAFIVVVSTELNVGSLSLPCKASALRFLETGSQYAAQGVVDLLRPNQRFTRWQYRA